MSQELTAAEALTRANNAETLLADPTLQKAFESVRQSILLRIEDSAIGERDFHHEAALSLQALKAVKRQLQKWVDDGKLIRERSK